MQTLKNLALYRSIISNPDHWFETSVFIGEGGDLIDEYGDKITFGDPEQGHTAYAISVVKSGPEYGTREENIRSISTKIEVFDKSMNLGAAVAAEIDLELEDVHATLPERAKITPYVRAVCRADDGVSLIRSEWIQQGLFYIDTRENTKNDDGLTILRIHGYDAMLMFEQYFEDAEGLWPYQVNPRTGKVTDAIDKDVVLFIANKIGVRVDVRTWNVMTESYKIPLPMGYTLREVLGYIAGAYAGCFIMNDVGDLRLISVTDFPAATNYLIDETGDVITFGEDIKTAHTGSNIEVEATDIDPENVGYDYVGELVLTLPYSASGYTGATIEYTGEETSTSFVADWTPSVSKIYGGTWDVITGYIEETYDRDGNELEYPNRYQVLPCDVYLEVGNNTFVSPVGVMSLVSVVGNSVRILV